MPLLSCRSRPGPIACSRSNSVILVVQPTSSACCTHSSPPDVARTSCTAATQPTSSLVVLLPARRLFGDHLHLHLILPSSVAQPWIIISFSPAQFCFTCQFLVLHPMAEVVSHYIHTRRLTRFLRFALGQKPFRSRLVPCGSPNRPIATCRLLVSPPLFLLLRI